MTNTTALKEKAAEMYATMNDSDRAIVKFGMTPADKAATLEEEFPGVTSREIALAFMAATKADGGMVV